MANIFTQTFIRYPIASWLAVGGFAYLWKASLIHTLYTREFYQLEESRVKELRNVQ